jgi:hypothetical protein
MPVPSGGEVPPVTPDIGGQVRSSEPEGGYPERQVVAGHGWGAPETPGAGLGVIRSSVVSSCRGGAAAQACGEHEVGCGMGTGYSSRGKP